MPADEATKFVETVIDVRRTRRDAFHVDLFMGEQGWDILLVLFLADARGERLTARQVLSRVGGPSAAGERWIRFLDDQGLTIGDGNGQLDDVVTATPLALHRVEEWAAAGVGTVRRLITPVSRPRRRW